MWPKSLPVPPVWLRNCTFTINRSVSRKSSLRHFLRLQNMRRVAFLIVLLLILTLSQMAFAQELASLTGVVADRTGAVVPDADVRLTDTKTNASYAAKTNSVGAYTFVK